MEPKRRRPRGHGALFYRKRDGIWIGRFKGSQVASSTRQGCLAKLQELLPEGVSAYVEPDDAKPLTDDQAARDRGTHTEAEWRAKTAAAGHRCNYCLATLTPATVQRDHIIPITRGGSDAIHNLAPSCEPCNKAKGSMTAEEFFRTLAEVRP